MFVGSFFVFVTILNSVYGTCQSLDGQSVPWWILYQQKERPFFHQYVDSTNSHRVKEHYPERRDSVLSKVMSSVIDKEEAEYIIYSSDLINVKDIAGKTSIPTYSKWMHGILGTTSSWKSGFWILHNNLLFPALTNGALSVPGSKAWYATTVGDSSADLFYICLTAENKGNITEILISIMAGNPFIYKKKLQNYDFLQPYFKEVRPLQTSFGYEMSATMFLNCMYTSRKNVSTNCLFTYAVTTGVGINVFTRPRGMIKHSSTFCYDDQSLSAYDFLKLEQSSSLKSGFTHSMFALSDQTGTTCFGQDVAANAETVAVMICTTLPIVHRNIIKSARLTQWSCRRENTNMKYKTEISNRIEMQQTSFSKPPIEQNEVGKTSNIIADDDDEKNETKFCQMYDCKMNEDTQNKQEMVDIDSSKSPIMKNQKIAYWFNAIANDVIMEDIMQNPRKKQTINKQTYYNAIKIKGSLEVSRFLLKNVKAVLGLFCREGCRFCQNAKEQFMWLARRIQTDDLDFVIVDILEPSLPDNLQVPFTPYVRYKFSGVSKWIAYSGNKYDVKNFVVFLHYTTTIKRFSSNSLSEANDDIDVNTNEFSYIEISERRRRDTRNVIDDQSNKLSVTKDAKSRRKRAIHDKFIDTHIWEYKRVATKVTKKEVKEEFDKVKGGSNRKRNTFLTTTNKTNTIDLLKSITDAYFQDKKFERADVNKTIGKKKVLEKRILFYDINIQDINVTLIYYENKNSECGYSITGSIQIGATINEAETHFDVYHFEKYISPPLTSCSEHEIQPEEICENKNEKVP